jgi:hypothetical protein
MRSLLGVKVSAYISNSIILSTTPIAGPPSKYNLALVTVRPLPISSISFARTSISIGSELYTPSRAAVSSTAVGLAEAIQKPNKSTLRPNPLIALFISRVDLIIVVVRYSIKEFCSSISILAPFVLSKFNLLS